MKRHDVLFAISDEQCDALRRDSVLTCSIPKSFSLNVCDQFSMVNGPQDTVDELCCAVEMTHITEHEDKRKRSMALCTVKRLSEFQSMI